MKSQPARTSKPWGFAAIPRERTQEIARRGAQAVLAKYGSVGRPFTSQSGANAGRKGGQVVGAIRRAEREAREKEWNEI